MTHISHELLKLDRNELTARMMCTDLDTVKWLAEQGEHEVRAVADCSYTFQKSGVSIENDIVTLSFGQIKSSSLAKCLDGSKSAFIVAVSLGHGVDLLLRRCSVGSSSKHFAVDAVASALCESLCDHVQSILPQKTKRRFSPGYGDLQLSVQAPLLEFLGNTNITLTESGLMIPSKSVTFIAGVEE